MIKVLYLPLGDQTGTCDAWNNVGVQLQIYNFWGDWLRYNDRSKIKNDFLNHVKNFQPHLIHMQLQFTGLLDVDAFQQARKICPGVVITNWSGDVRATAQPTFTSISNSIDYSLISSTGQLDLYQKSGCPNIKYWQIGYDPKVAFPLNKTNFKYDISFTGNNYGNTFPDGPLRYSAVQDLISAFGDKFGLFGANYPGMNKSTLPHESNEIYNDSLCVLSISNFNSISHYFSDRLLLCLASGRPTISWNFPGCEDYFVDKRDIFIANSNKDIIDAVKYCKANPKIANEIGYNGHTKVVKEHTFTSRVIELLHMTNLAHMV